MYMGIKKKKKKEMEKEGKNEKVLNNDKYNDNQSITRCMYKKIV